jgi:hypothetical protein
VRAVTLKDASGEVVLSLSVAPNPEGRTAADWVASYPETPGDSTEVMIDGAVGLLFEEDQVGDANATVYFAHGGNIFGLRGKTGMTSGAGGPSPPTIAREDFDLVWQGLELGG